MKNLHPQKLKSDEALFELQVWFSRQPNEISFGIIEH